MTVSHANGNGTAEPPLNRSEEVKDVSLRNHSESTYIPSEHPYWRLKPYPIDTNF
jgi:hypothetical protein